MKKSIGLFIISLIIICISFLVYYINHNIKSYHESLSEPPIQPYNNVQVIFNYITDEKVIYTTIKGTTINTGLIETENGLYRIWWTETKDGDIIEFKLEK